MSFGDMLTRHVLHRLSERSRFAALAYLYHRGRKGGNRRMAVDRGLSAAPVFRAGPCANALVCLDRFDHALTAVLDFELGHPSLDDLLMWQMQLLTTAMVRGKTKIDIVLVNAPSGEDRWCHHQAYLDTLPALYTNPLLRDVHHLRDRADFEAWFARDEMGFVDREIVAWSPQTCQDPAPLLAFHEEYGRLPGLVVPKGIDVMPPRSVVGLRPEFCIVGVVVSEGSVDRWAAFFKELETIYPEMIFAVLGDPEIWPESVQAAQNVTFLRAIGLGSIEELALAQQADVMVGEPLGPSLMSIFGSGSYIFFCGEESALGLRSLPFAAANQVLCEEMDVTAMVATFRDFFEGLKTFSGSSFAEGKPLPQPQPRPLAKGDQSRFAMWGQFRKSRSTCPSEKVLHGVWDYHASPFALGDILTWTQRLRLQAMSKGLDHIDIHILADPFGPANINQAHINPSNYQKFMLAMMPLFYNVPMVRHVHTYQDRQTLEARLVVLTVKGVPCTPCLGGYVAECDNRLAAYNRHDLMNDWFARNGSLPFLEPPPPTAARVRALLDRLGKNRFFVCVHLRQRNKEPGSWGYDFRNANMDHWLNFFAWAEKHYPEVFFTVVGNPVEWPWELHKRANVQPLKTLGFGLTEEMALIRECDMFMGSNSGPAVMAVFGEKPYLIFQSMGNAHESAHVYDVPIGTERLPFANPHQKYLWGKDAPEDIIQAFEALYCEIR